ncbi:hypothetical protein [Promicromonospora sp. NPDC057488]|uniref:hypothetical protein n=1 Tax=Promicromonospora sp. NPDC057488 TaxID=3346147 RepID=UPI003670E9CA
MSDAWHPDIRRELLPGPSEVVLSNRSLACTLTGIVASVVVLAVLFVEPMLWVWGLVPAGVAVGCIATGGFLDSAAASRQADEARAGYTTVLTESTDLDFVDDLSGRLVRRAGEALTVHEIRDRLRRVRTAR